MHSVPDVKVRIEAVELEIVKCENKANTIGTGKLCVVKYVTQCKYSCLNVVEYNLKAT